MKKLIIIPLLLISAFCFSQTVDTLLGAKGKLVKDTSLTIDGNYLYTPSRNHLSFDSSKVVLPASTNTLTNKRWIPRVDSITTSANPTINTDNVDIFKITTLTDNISSFTTNLSGSPSGGEIIEIQITGLNNGTGNRSITWGSSFASTSVLLPTTAVVGTTLTIILQYYKSSSYGNNKWLCVNFY